MAPLGTLGIALDHDVVITSSEGTRLGLMLARADQVKKAWQVAEIPAPSGVRVSTGGSSAQDSPPEMAASVFRTDNTGGMGARISQNVGTFLIANTDKDYMSGGVNTSISGKVIKPPFTAELTLPTSEGKVLCMAEYKAALYVSDGRYLHKSTDGATFTQVLDVGAAMRISNLTVYGNASAVTGMVICYETDTAAETAQTYYFTTDGTVFTQATAAGNRQFNYVFVKDKTLYGLVNPNTFYTTTEPFVVGAVWGTATQVGDQAHLFQGGFVVAGVLVIFKEDRVFTVDGSGVVDTLIAQFANIPSLRNFSAFTSGWNSNIYFTVDTEVWEYDPATGAIRKLGVGTLPDSQIAVTTVPRAGLAYSDDDALYSIHQTNLSATPGPSVIHTTFDADGHPVHDRWCVETLNGYRPQGTLLFSRLFTGISTGRHLFMATTTAGKIGRMTIPRAVDPTTDTTSEYSEVDCVYRSGWMHHNFPAQWKDYTQILLDLRGLQAAPPQSTVGCYYYLDGDLTTRYTMDASLDSNKLHDLEFSNGVSAQTFLLELVLHTDARSTTPQVISWNVKASVKFDFREVITIAVRVGDRIPNRQGNRGPHTAQEIRDRLRAWRAQTNITLGYSDYRGYSFDNMRILTGFNEVDEVDDKDRTNETVLTIRIMRISESDAALFVVGTDTVFGSHVVGP